jgi:hypothetical protein
MKAIFTIQKLRNLAIKMKLVFYFEIVYQRFNAIHSSI